VFNGRNSRVEVDSPEEIGSLVYRRCGPYVISRMDIGAWDGGDRYLDGPIDFLYLYKGAMPEQDVMSLYASLGTM
jgi:hypothetical protein